MHGLRTRSTRTDWSRPKSTFLTSSPPTPPAPLPTTSLGLSSVGGRVTGTGTRGETSGQCLHEPVDAGLAVPLDARPLRPEETAVSALPVQRVADAAVPVVVVVPVAEVLVEDDGHAGRPGHGTVVRPRRWHRDSRREVGGLTEGRYVSSRDTKGPPCKCCVYREEGEAKTLPGKVSGVSVVDGD